MATKKVYLKCNRPFVHGQINSPEAQEQLSLSKKSVGSFFVNKHSTRKGTGLVEEEVKLLLPLLLDIPAESLEFRKEVDKFYTEINTHVPYNDKGLELEIGLELDNDLPVTYFEEREIGGEKMKAYNLPINLEDYVCYRHAQAHPDCAPNPKTAKGNSTVMFYLEDPEETTKDAIYESELKDKALNLYQQLKDDKKKVKAVLTLLAGFLTKKRGEIVVVDSLTDEQKIVRFRELATSDKHYKKFYEVASDPDVFNRYLITELIRVNLLKKAGTSILVTESHEVLGVNMDEAVNNLFKNPGSAQLLAALKEQYSSHKNKALVGR